MVCSSRMADALKLQHFGGNSDLAAADISGTCAKGRYCLSDKLGTAQYA